MIFEDLQRAVEELESDSSLFEPEQLRRRIEVVDLLDSIPGIDAPGEPRSLIALWHDGAVVAERARRLRARLDEANVAVYRGIRQEIQRGAGASTLPRWIDVCRDRSETAAPGLGYDALDELIAGVLEIEEPRHAPADPGPEQVFYQPTPVRHALDLIQQSSLSKGDVLIDLGSGLGHVCMLLSILTGAQAVGIEVEGAYVASARACAARLGLSSVTSVQQDAREADLSAGTVFWLYTPFTGSMLETVLRRLQQEAETRIIRIGALGPCTERVAEQRWLKALAPATADRVAVFLSGA